MNKSLAVITGCSSGFGLLSTIELARNGHFVIATMRDLSRRAALDEAIAAAGLSASVSIQPLDVANPASHQPFIDGVFSDYGRIDLLVNNAGFALAGFAEDVSLEELRRQFETNFFGTVSLTKAVLPIMRRQRSGRILMLSSIAGRSAAPAMSSYSASKFALEGYTESLRLEMAPLGIHCVLIEPGSFETGIWYHAENVAARASSPDSPNLQRTTGFRNYIQKQVNRRDPGDVARLIARLATVPNPRFRYPIGQDARFLLILRAVLPFSVFQNLAIRTLKLGSE